MTGQQLANFIMGGGLLLYAVFLAVFLLGISKGKW